MTLTGLDQLVHSMWEAVIIAVVAQVLVADQPQAIANSVPQTQVLMPLVLVFVIQDMEDHVVIAILKHVILVVRSAMVLMLIIVNGVSTMVC